MDRNMSPLILSASSGAANEPGLQGMLTFEKDAYFSGNLNDNLYYGSGPGGAISVHVKGAIHFMGKLVMENNIADVRNMRPNILIGWLIRSTSRVRGGTNRHVYTYRNLGFYWQGPGCFSFYLI